MIDYTFWQRASTLDDLNSYTVREDLEAALSCLKSAQERLKSAQEDVINAMVSVQEVLRKGRFHD